MLLSILYIIGITAEAMTGALAAGRRQMDMFGVIIIASATAIGGGSVRDMLLGHFPWGGSNILNISLLLPLPRSSPPGWPP